MRGDNEPVRAVDAVLKPARDQDETAIALSVFDALDKLQKVSQAERISWPYPPRKPDKNGVVPPWTDNERACAHADITSENMRRLRTTMWAEVQLRKAHQSYANMLASHHRAQWRIALVSEDSAERERQMADALRQP